MKKLFILIVCCILTSCYKTDPKQFHLYPGSYSGECSTSDSVLYYTSININYDEAELYLVKKEIKRVGVDKYLLGDKEIKVSRDTAILTHENYRFTPMEFKEFLNTTNKIPRDTSIFLITPTMYCPWYLFKRVYNEYYY